MDKISTEKETQQCYFDNIEMALQSIATSKNPLKNMGTFPCYIKTRN